MSTKCKTSLFMTLICACVFVGAAPLPSLVAQYGSMKLTTAVPDSSPSTRQTVTKRTNALSSDDHVTMPTMTTGGEKPHGRTTVTQARDDVMQKTTTHAGQVIRTTSNTPIVMTTAPPIEDREHVTANDPAPVYPTTRVSAIDTSPNDVTGEQASLNRPSSEVTPNTKQDNTGQSKNDTQTTNQRPDVIKLSIVDKANPPTPPAPCDWRPGDSRRQLFAPLVGLYNFVGKILSQYLPQSMATPSHPHAVFGSQRLPAARCKVGGRKQSESAKPSEAPGIEGEAGASAPKPVPTVNSARNGPPIVIKHMRVGHLSMSRGIPQQHIQLIPREAQEGENPSEQPRLSDNSPPQPPSQLSLLQDQPSSSFQDSSANQPSLYQRRRTQYHDLRHRVFDRPGRMMFNRGAMMDVPRWDISNRPAVLRSSARYHHPRVRYFDRTPQMSDRVGKMMNWRLHDSEPLQQAQQQVADSSAMAQDRVDEMDNAIQANEATVQDLIDDITANI